MEPSISELFATETTGPSPFDALRSEGASSTSPDVVELTAQLAALVDIGPDPQNLDARWTKRKAEVTDEIVFNGVHSTRMSVAAAQRQREVESLGEIFKVAPQVDPTGELREGAVLATRQAINTDLETKSKYALEKEAVRNIQLLAASDPDQAELMFRNMEQGDALEIKADIMTKRLMFSRMIAEATEDLEERNFLEMGWDFLTGMAPIRPEAIRTGNVDIPKEQQRWYDNLWAGRRERLETNALMSMSAEEFADFAPKFLENIRNNTDLLGLRSKAGELNILREYTQQGPSDLESGLRAGLGFLDAATLGVSAAGKLGKVGTVVRSLTAGGARKQAVGLAAQQVLAGSIDDSLEAALLPGAMSTTPPVSTVSTGLAVSNKLLEAEELAKSLPKIMSDRMTPEQLELAVDATRADLRKQVPETSIVAEDRVSVEGPGGIRTWQVHARIGTRDGAAFGRKQDAEAMMSKMGLQGEAITDESGGWYINYARDVGEMGFIKPTEVLQGTTSLFSRKLLGSKNAVDDFVYGLGNMAEGHMQKMRKHFTEALKPAFGKLSTSEYSDLSAVIDVGKQEQKWFTQAEFNGIYSRAYNRAPSVTEWESYQLYKDVNDIMLASNNANQRAIRAIRGMENVSINGMPSDMNAVVKDISTLSEGNRIYDVSSGTLYNKTNRLTPELIDSYKAKGYHVIELEDAVNAPGGSRVTQVLARKGDFTRGPLKHQQMGITEGGNRFYADRNFVKQAKVLKLEDGSEVLDAPRAYVAGTKAEVEAWAKLANEIKDYFMKIVDEGVVFTRKQADEMRDMVNASPAHIDLVEFLDDLKSGRIDPREKFEAVADRALPSRYAGMANEFAVSDDIGLAKSSGRMYYSRKGDQLKDFRGNVARTLDPYKSINKALMNMSSTTSLFDMRITAIERWMDKFGAYLDIPESTRGLSNEYKFVNASLKKGIDAKLAHQATGERDAISRMLNWKTEEDLQLEHIETTIAEFVAGPNPGMRDKFVDNARNWLRDNNPVHFLKGMAFDMKLGFFNPTQLFVQGSTYMSILALNPKRALQAAGGYMPTRAFIASRGNQALLEQFVKGGVHKLMGLEADEFATYMNSLNNSGILDIGGAHSLIGETSSAVALGGFGKIERARQAGRFFFTEAERGNLMTAYRAAWGEVGDTFPDLERTSREFQRRVYSKAMDYSFGMQSASNAAWQRGLMSLPTQFFSYNAKMLEAMFSKTFTRQQRMRLAVANFLFYGTAGIPLAGIVTDLKNKANGTTPEPGTLEAVFDRGMLDLALYTFSGEDVSITNRMASGEFIQNLVGTIFNMGEYGPTSVGEAIGGATFGIWGQTLGDTADWVKYVAAESGEPGIDEIRGEAFQRLARNISTIDVGLKAWMVHRYGTYISSRGTVQISDLPSTEAWTYMLGAKPGELDRMGAMLSHNKDFDDAVKDATKVLSNYRRRYLNEPDNRTEIRQEINAFTSLLPDRVAKAARRKANNESQSLYNDIAERTQRLKEQEANGFSPTKP